MEKHCKIIEDHQKEIKEFQFNQQSNFLYHFVNKFTDKEIKIEAIKEEINKLTK